MLRKELVELMGMEAAMGVLTRFGYAQGWWTLLINNFMLLLGEEHRFSSEY